MLSSTKSLIIFALISYLIQTAHALPVYDFEADTVGQAPANISAANGTLVVQSHMTEGMAMSPQTATSGGTAVFDLSLFPIFGNYSVSWKETYTSAGRSGVILRGTGSNSNSAGAKRGYLFQANPALDSVAIYRSNSNGYALISTAALTASGVNTPRWYRATVDGSTLTFEYSNDGASFTQLSSISDTSYTAAGATQFIRGFGRIISGSFIDDVEFQAINAVDSVTATNISEYQVFQRDESNQADIFVSGTYVGSPTTIEARWNGGDYSIIDPTPENGLFSGTLANQPVGQGTLNIRFSNDGAISSSINNVAIGDIFIVAGQSNASGRGNNNNAYTHATLKASLFGNDDVWKELSDPYDSAAGQVDNVSRDGSGAAGSPWPLVATQIMADHGVPVAFVPTAKGGTSIQQWQPGANHSNAATLYGSMNRRIHAVGGNVTGVLFFQGESDSSTGTTQENYEIRLNIFVDSVDADFPGTKTLVGQIGHSNLAGKDRVRTAQINTIVANTNALLGPATYDINLADEGGDTLHFKSNADMAEFARRWYAAINKQFYSGADGYGPILDSAKLFYDVVEHKLILPFTDDSSPIISVSSTVSPASFKLTYDAAPITITSVAIVGNTIEITPTVALTEGQAITLSYASLNDGVNKAIYDSHNYPAQPFYVDEVIFGREDDSNYIVIPLAEGKAAVVPL